LVILESKFMSKTRNFSLAANAGIVLAFTTLTSAIAYRAGLSSAGTGGSTEPISDIIQAIAALAGVLVAGYGIFMSGKHQRIADLEAGFENYQTYERAMAKLVIECGVEKIIDSSKILEYVDPEREARKSLRKYARIAMEKPKLLKNDRMYNNPTQEADFNSGFQKKIQ
jgi:hypothetical protein